jgi:predicted ATPase/class 3 adenylate cyclase/GAF domain-containing protein
VLRKEDDHLILSGKYDQFQKSTPYSAFVEILKKLFIHLSLQSKEKLDQDVKLILNILQERANIIVKLIPESKYILGENIPTLIDLPSENDEQKRFMATIVDLFSIFASDGKCLSLFIDDLQWADSPSFMLIEELLNQNNVKIFIIGAYRDNEITSTHPVTTIIQPILTERNFITISLNNLKLEHIESFLRDSLKSEDIKELSELTFKKTNGNPFFMREFILTLYETKLISFDYSKEKWIWSIKEISETKFSDNVVDFMVNHLTQYSEKTKKILNFASCIGNTFSLDLLSLVYEKTVHETYKDLLEPLALGWIYEKDSSTFKFLHDRLQQAAYEIFEDKKKIHLKIGQVFLENAKKNDQLDLFIFDIVNNLNEASEIFQDKSELISLNLNASKVAAKNFAFDPALKFSSFAKSLLDQDAWKNHHSLSFDVFFLHANNFFLTSRLKEATEIYQELIKNCTTNFESLKAIVSFSKLLLLEANFGEAIRVIFEIFSLYDVSKDMPNNNMELFNEWSMKLFKELLDYFKDIPDGKTFLELIPKNANEEMSLLSKYMLQSSAVFYQTAQSHFATATQLMGVKLAILHGNNEFLPALLASLSWHSQFHFETSSGSVFSNIVQDLTKNITSPSISLYVKFYSGLSSMFHGNPSNCIKLTESAYYDGFSIGEFNWGSYSCYCWMNFNICNGSNFFNLQTKSLAAQKTVYAAQHPFIGDMMESSIQTMNIIIGNSTKFEPKHAIPIFLDLPFGRFNYYCLKAISLYLLQDFKGAKESLDILNTIPKENIGLPHYYDISLYSIFVHYALFKQTKNEEYFEIMKKNCVTLKKYADQNPIYFKCRYLLGEAIIQTLSQEKPSFILEIFEDAIEESHKRNISWIEAMAYEYAADFCRQSSRYKEYSVHLTQQAYKKWKNMGVKIRFENLFFTLNSNSELKGKTTNTISYTNSTSNSVSTSVFSLDLESIIKSSNAISEDLDKKKLLSKLNKVIMENAGANKALIILKENGKFIVNSEIRNSESFESMEEITEDSPLLSLRIFNQCVNQHETILYRNAMTETHLKQDQYIQFNSVKSVLCAPIIKGKKISGVLYLENNTMEGAFTESRKFILKHILSQVAISIENSNLYEDVKKINEDIITINKAYSRFLPTEFLNQLEKKDVRNIQPSESVEKNMTILFSDIRDFTTITDAMDAKESFSFVNEILNELAPPIRQNKGFVDKFIGDCVMAIFPKSPLDAVKCGIQMLNALKKLNQNRQIPINIGVGIAYGSVMIGTLGYEKRLDATVISSTVNTASRMESLTKSLGVNLLITEEVYQEIKSSSEVFCYFLGSFYLKGQKDAKKLYEVMSLSEKNVFDFKTFGEALELFQQKKFNESKVIFKTISQFGIVKYYLKVCKLYELNNLPDHWNGEIKLSKDGDPQQIVSDVNLNSIDKITILQNLMNDPDQLDYLFENSLKLLKKIK